MSGGDFESRPHCECGLEAALDCYFLPCCVSFGSAGGDVSCANSGPWGRNSSVRSGLVLARLLPECRVHAVRSGRGADSLDISSPNRSGQAPSAALISFSGPQRAASPSDWLPHGPTARGPCTWPSWRWKGAFSSALSAPRYPHEAPVCTLYRFSSCFL